MSEITGTKRRRGRQPYVPTERDRESVTRMRANRIPLAVIARIMAIDLTTLQKHYKTELENGKENVIAALSSVILRAALQGDVRAAESWLKRFGGPDWATIPGGDTVIP